MNYKVFEKYRVRKNISKQDLAKKVGKSPGWYSKLISGEMPLRSQYVAPMAEALGVNPKKLAAEYFSDQELEDNSTKNSKTA